MGPRRDLKREISRISKLLLFSPNSVTSEERDNLKQNLVNIKLDLQAQIKGKTLTVTDEEIDTRDEIIRNSPEISEVFQAFWFVMLPFTVDGLLQKPAYLKLQMAFQFCLIGFISEEQAHESAEADWVQDSYLFGPMNQTAFNGVLFEILHMWVDKAKDEKAFAIFAWSLLVSIADMTAHPPKLRPKRTIRCMGSLREAELYKTYVKDSELRKRIFSMTTAENYMSSQNIAALNRASQRSLNVVHNDDEIEHMKSMLEVMERQAAKNRHEVGSGTDTDSDGENLDLDDDTCTEGSIGWRRDQERLAKEEADRLAALAGAKKQRRKLKNRNARGFFLEIGRGEGSDTYYNPDSWGGESGYGGSMGIRLVNKLLGGGADSWLGQGSSVGKGKHWKKDALMEFLGRKLGGLHAGKSREEIAALAKDFDFASLKIAWLQELSIKENERRCIKILNSDGREYNRPALTTGMFGVSGKSPKSLESLYKAKRQTAENIRMMRGGNSKSGKLALELLLGQRQREPLDSRLMSNLVLTGTGELGVKVHTSPPPRSPSPPKLRGGSVSLVDQRSHGSSTAAVSHHMPPDTGLFVGAVSPFIGYSVHASPRYCVIDDELSVGGSDSDDGNDALSIKSGVSALTSATRADGSQTSPILASMPSLLKKQLQQREIMRREEFSALHFWPLQGMTEEHGMASGNDDSDEIVDGIECGDAVPEGHEPHEATSWQLQTQIPENHLPIDGVACLGRLSGSHTEIPRVITSPELVYAPTLTPPTLKPAPLSVNTRTLEDSMAALVNSKSSGGRFSKEPLVRGLNTLRSSAKHSKSRHLGSSVSPIGNKSVASDASQRYLPPVSPNSSVCESASMLSMVSYDSSPGHSSVTGRNGQPQLILPPIVALLEQLYVGSQTKRSLVGRPKWHSAGASAKKRKEDDAARLAASDPYR